MRRVLRRDFFARSVHEVAPDLIGATFLVDGVGGVIVEAEAYDGEDPASHGFRGRTARNASMFGPAGQAYVYRSYGIHWCVNVMRARRGVHRMRALCSGPGKLCQALGITREHDGLALDRPPFELRERGEAPQIVTGPRIGITQATELSWRYCLAGSPYLSRPTAARARR
jgi:DNA-3-methyladenine glycosylase